MFATRLLTKSDQNNIDEFATDKIHSQNDSDTANWFNKIRKIEPDRYRYISQTYLVAFTYGDDR